MFSFFKAYPPNKFLILNSPAILFQYFFVYLVEIIINNVHIKIRATTLEIASSIPNQISNKKIFQLVKRIKYNQIVLNFILSFAIPLNNKIDAVIHQ
jgi:hypothetical protein